MKELLLKLHTISKAMLIRDDGQDLPEYALVVVMLALGTVAGMSSIAGGVNQTFLAVSNTLTTAV